MTDFATRRLPEAPDVLAPDGSEVRILAGLPAGSMSHFRLTPGAGWDGVRNLRLVSA